ncbi:MAG: DUF1292 domain-containing protein [Oscillospiraceae bacterium]|nr:DUF1292 domain-containing protein [Oscillospiraceae bacterium]
MSELFGDDFITITDEDGVEYELEVLCSVEYQGSTYLGVCPADQDEDAELEVSVLKVTEEDGEELLEAVTDEDELAAVYELLLEDYEENADEEDEPEGDEA